MPDPQTPDPLMLLLSLLLEAEAPMPLASLGARLGLPALKIAPLVESLRTHGCTIDAHPQHGVRLTASSITLWSDYIEATRAGKIGCKLKVFRRTASTQELARQVVRRDPTGHVNHVIVADEQTAGRGRLGRHWVAGPGEALLLSAIVRPPRASIDRLMLASCHAVAETVEAFALRAEVRWPNDVLVAGAKVAGTLVDLVEGTAVIGIGLNVLGAPADLPPDEGFSPRATSLAQHHVRADRLRVLAVLLDRLDHAIHHAADETLREAWRQRSCLTRRRVTVATDGKKLIGQVIDIDPEHGLLLQVEHGPVVTLAAGTTSLIHAG